MRTRKILPNDEIRQEAFSAGVRHWEISKALGISEPTLTRWLRSELPEEKKQKILAAIKQIAEEGE